MSNVKNQTLWTIDPAHSEILFKIRHMMITNVKGEFRKFDATVKTDDNDFSTAQIQVVIDASSIYTNNEDRDKHLRSGDFFHVEDHEEIRFESTGMKKAGSEDYELIGDLTMRGVTKEIHLKVEFGGIINDPYGNERAGFSVSGKFSRKDWGLNWNSVLEAGGVMVSDEVRINAEVQFVKQTKEVLA